MAELKNSNAGDWTPLIIETVKLRSGEYARVVEHGASQDSLRVQLFVVDGKNIDLADSVVEVKRQDLVPLR